QDQVHELADRLNSARTVTLFCGAGVRGAHDEVMALAEKLQSPIGHSLRGKEWVQYDNPYDVGMSGLLGYGACYDATHRADLLVLLGTDFPYDGFLPQRHTVQVDHDLSRLGRRTPLDLAVHGDVTATLRAVLPLVKQKSDPSFLHDMLREHTRALEHVVDAYTRDIATRAPLTTPRSRRPSAFTPYESSSRRTSARGTRTRGTSPVRPLRTTSPIQMRSRSPRTTPARRWPASRWRRRRSSSAAVSGGCSRWRGRTCETFRARRCSGNTGTMNSLLPDVL